MSVQNVCRIFSSLPLGKTALMVQTSQTSRALKMQALCCFKMSGTDYPVMVSYTPQEQSPRPHHHENLTDSHTSSNH